MCTENHVSLGSTYTCTNITLSQKRLEIQALRCNGETTGSGRCQREDITVRQRCLQRGSPPQSSQACGPARATALASPPLGRSQWSSAPAGLRVVVLAGHLLAWLGSRQSVEPVTGRFVDTTTCLQDKRDEVVLVGVLRRFDRGVGLRRMSRCVVLASTTALVDIARTLPVAHHADNIISNAILITNSTSMVRNTSIPLIKTILV
jgi:hypothetical protein